MIHVRIWNLNLGLLLTMDHTAPCMEPLKKQRELKRKLGELAHGFGLKYLCFKYR